MMNYKEQVYFLLTQIPKGKVVTYGQIAEQLGSRHLARAVGNILHENYEGYSPAYTRTNLTDKLHEKFNFRTDYEFITEKNIKKIFRDIKK